MTLARDLLAQGLSAWWWYAFAASFVVLGLALLLLVGAEVVFWVRSRR